MPQVKVGGDLINIACYLYKFQHAQGGFVVDIYVYIGYCVLHFTLIIIQVLKSHIRSFVELSFI